MKNKMTENIQQLKTWLDEADSVLIGAGAGLSADAGFDYADEKSFARNYPALLQYGLKRKLDLMGFNNFIEELEWGYYLANVKEVRFCEEKQPLYDKLLTLVKEKNYFVITTNADAFFQRNGFDKERIYTPQGDYAFMQCARPCNSAVWPVKPVLDEFLPLIDPGTQMLPKGRVPRCPVCGGRVYLNVRGGNWFIDDQYREAGEKYRAWLRENMDGELLVIDIGSGFNTPVWIRWPAEEIVRRNRKAHLVRINLHHPEIPSDIKSRSLSFGSKAGDVVFAC